MAKFLLPGEVNFESSRVTLGWDKLTPGSYITVAVGDPGFKSIRAQTAAWGKRHGQMLSCRRQPDGSIRVYRADDGSQTPPDTDDTVGTSTASRRGRKRIGPVVPEGGPAYIMDIPDDYVPYSDYAVLDNPLGADDWFAALELGATLLVPVALTHDQLMREVARQSTRLEPKWFVGVFDDDKLSVKREK